MKILLVRPKPSPDTIGLQHVMIVEPLELEILGGLAVEGGHDCRIADFILERSSLEKILTAYKPDVLAVTGYITNVPEMIDACRRAKAFNATIITIVGGVHCEVCPQDLDDRAVDYRVVRNAVQSFPALLASLSGNLAGQKAKPSAGILIPGVLAAGEALVEFQLPELDFSYHAPLRSLTAAYRHKYFYIFHDKVALLKTSFGCPYQCEFCFCRRITRGAYAERPLDQVIQELASIQEKEVYIVDDDFLVSPQRVRDFLKAIRGAGLGKSYLLYGRADFIAQNPGLIREFKELGLRTVIVGLESFFDAELERYAKGTDAKTNARAMEVLRENGVDCFATVIAAPDWGPAEFKACADKLIELGVNYVNLQPYTPLPGSGLDMKDDELLIPRSDFHKWDLAHLTIKPTQLSVADYYRQMLALYQRVLFQGSYLKEYFLKYKPRMWLKMLTGSARVRAQYLRKIKEAENA